jgi:CheY-like chemotaxis protein
LKSVLVVEDDEAIRTSLIDILTDEGHHVLSASNGEEGLEVLRNASPLPCLIILDLMMPVLDGLGFRKAQLEDSSISHVPTALFSADTNIRAKAEANSIQEFLRKPIDLDQLFELINKYCKSC